MCRDGRFHFFCSQGGRVASEYSEFSEFSECWVESEYSELSEFSEFSGICYLEIALGEFKRGGYRGLIA